MKRKAMVCCLALALTLALCAPALACGPAEAGKFVSISAGFSHALAIKADGSLWAWGDNEAGQLGVGQAGGKRDKPVKIMDHVVACAAGDFCSAAIREDGSLWTWGRFTSNEAPGALADKTRSAAPRKVMDGAAAVSCGWGSFYAVKTDGTLWAWGDNVSNQLGNGGAGLRYQGDDAPYLRWQEEPVQILSGIRAVSAGPDYALALGVDGSLWGWGNMGSAVGVGADDSIDEYVSEPWYDPEAQKFPLALDYLYPVKVMTGVKAMSGGFDASFAVKEDGSLWGWGWNLDGNLGNGGIGEQGAEAYYENEYIFNGIRYRSDYRSDQTRASWTMDGVRAVSAGGQAAMPNVYLTCAVKEDGSLWAWGSAFYGLLGNGMAAGNAVNEDGAAIQTVPVRVMEGVEQVSAGGSFILALKTDGTIWSWGANQVGQLGNGGKSNAEAWNWAIQTRPAQVFTGALRDKLHTETVTVDGKAVALPSYLTQNSNYFKARDLAALLTGTAAQFDVTWNSGLGAVEIVTGKPYTAVGGELAYASAGAAIPSEAALYVDGQPVPCGAYTLSPLPGGAGNNYYKLRDLADAVGFTVDWSAEGGVSVHTW